ncbi:MAG: hypothetical protein GXY90_10465 [Peptococcaceae bacterium]|nr:hypothetical protein [Peptococcaceae bacterium]
MPAVYQNPQGAGNKGHRSNRLTIASHRRSYGRGEEVYDLNHYLETLNKRCLGA